MTALATVEARADLTERAIEVHDLAEALARDLDLAGYTDLTLLSVHRSQYRLSARWSREVMGSLALLGSDLEARD